MHEENNLVNKMNESLNQLSLSIFLYKVFSAQDLSIQSLILFTTAFTPATYLSPALSKSPTIFVLPNSHIFLSLG